MAEETLPASELGTKEYWDSVYVKEYENFNDHGDLGEIWFGENTMKRLVNWISQCRFIDKQASILDLGCGNGVFLLHLLEAGFKNLTGVDYSDNAIKLATNIVAVKNKQIQLEVGNILDVQEGSGSCIAFNKKYHICTDKGTYDAISLDPDDAMGKRKVYVQNVVRLLHASGLLVLTSCNWTKEELSVHFGKAFEVLEEIPTPQFQFGGRKGQRVTSLVMKVRAHVDP